MKKERQAKILELITLYRIETQEELSKRLTEAGINSAQTTVSRDLTELDIVKTNRYYQVAKRETDTHVVRMNNVYKQAVKSVDSACNQVVVKTLPGMGSAVGVAIDSMNFDSIIGTIAGDDTVLIILKGYNEAETLRNILHEMIG